MTIKLHGYLPDKELGVLTNLLNEHGYKQDLVGYFTDDEFISEIELPDEIVELIASTFMPTSDSIREARAEAQRQALFSEYDKKVLQYQREVRLGVAGAEEMLAAWDAYAESLQAINDTEGWYRDPQWPVKPEV